MIETLFEGPTLAILSGWAAAALVIGEALYRLVFIGVILSRKGITPDSRIAWIMVILAIPLIGWLMYLMFGRRQLGHERIQRHQEVLQIVKDAKCHPELDPDVVSDIELTESHTQIASLAEQASGTLPLRGNKLKLFGDTTDIIDAIIKDIDGAQHHCHFLFYIWLADGSGTAVGEAIIRAAKRGVKTRVLVDHIGSKGFLKSDLCRKMRAQGVQVIAALHVNPFRAIFHRIDLRNHRKIIIIDGEIGWTGSQNMADADFAPKPKFAPWVDCAIRIEGPTAKELQLLFVEDWFMDTDERLDAAMNQPCVIHPEGIVTQVVPSGPDYKNASANQLVQACIQIARKEIVLTTPYFVPDGSSIMNMVVAAQRGVEVTLVTPRRNDSMLVGLASRSNYAPLLEAGVKIHEFTEGLLHAKTISVDRNLGLITSANLDRRSFNLNYEAGVLVYDSDFTSQLRFLQQSYIENSIKINLQEWNERGVRKRMLENLAGLLSPML